MTLIRFLLVGIINTLIGLGIIYAAMYFLSLNAVSANALGYSIGIMVSFALNKTWTFNSADHVGASFFCFILVIAMAYVTNLATVLVVHDYLTVNIYIAQALGIAPYTAITYLGSRFFVFRKQLKNQKPTVIDDKKLKPLITRPININIVIPCFNEESVLPETSRQLTALLQNLIARGKITADSGVYFVDDGSHDKTWELIESLAKTNPSIHGIKLSRNRGHQNALLAGLLSVEGETVISIDADLQDDLSAIEKMIVHYTAGHDIVYGVRGCRKTDTFFKNFSAQAYYRLLQMMGVEIIHNHADFRLMSRRAIEALKEFGEVNLFLRGIIPQLGFSWSLVYYNRAERYAGESKYPLRKMLSLAWQGVTSFSDLPLHFITGLGFLVSIISLGITAWVLWVRFFTQDAIPGWASTVLPIYFISGIQLLCLGVIGEYLAKVYTETKRRPRYIIEKITAPFLEDGKVTKGQIT